MGHPPKEPIRYHGGRPVWRCTKCGTEGTAKSGVFPKAKHTANGLSSWCKKCHRNAVEAGRSAGRYVQ